MDVDACALVWLWEKGTDCAQGGCDQVSRKLEEKMVCVLGERGRKNLLSIYGGEGVMEEGRLRLSL